MMQLNLFPENENKKEYHQVRKVTYIYVTTFEEAKKRLEFLMDAPVIGVDIETTSLHPEEGEIRLIQIAAKGAAVTILDCFKIGLENLKFYLSRLFEG